MVGIHHDVVQFYAEISAGCAWGIKYYDNEYMLWAQQICMCLFFFFVIHEQWALNENDAMAAALRVSSSDNVIILPICRSNIAGNRFLREFA